MFIPDFEQRAAQATPQRVREIELAHAAPVHQAALQRAVGIAPEPGVVDVRVPVAERDELRVGVQEAFDRGLVLQKTLRFLLEARDEFRRARKSVVEGKSVSVRVRSGGSRNNK